ncbi:hypothetical protein RND81_01G059600 [Saponaria officinalis]|uniref:DUF6598 domain-containing protein n=1 Tax=Saponaria officinalis TaxID=3572 RepID=A0AAW1NDB5_SAPOF
MANGVDKKRLYRYLDLMVTPLVEIFGVTIHCEDNELLEDDYGIYGQIQVIDKLDKSFYIFNQDKDHPQRISFNEPLLLTAPLTEIDAVIIPSEHASMDVLLFDRIRNDSLVAKGSISFDRSITDKEEWLEEKYEKRLPGEKNLYAKVQYAIFPYAVTANVDVSFFTKDDDFDSLVGTSGIAYLSLKYGDADPEEWPDRCDVTDYSKNKCCTMANLYGTVSTTCIIDGNDGKISYPWSLLFRNSNEDSIELTSGDFIDLSRSVVAVPAYSSLIIQASFYYRDSSLPAASGILEFKPNHNKIAKQDIVGDNGRIRVRVVWGSAYWKLCRVSSKKRLTPLTPQIEESRSSDSIKRLKPFEEHHSLVAMNDDCVLPEQHPAVGLEW